MKKLLIGLSVLLVSAGVLLAQKPVLSIDRLQLAGEVGSALSGKFDIYNTGGTANVSQVTIESSDTNVLTVNTSSATISNNYLQITATAASGLKAGNYRAEVLVTQTNSPETALRLPVTIIVTRDIGVAKGDLAAIRVVQGNLGPVPALAPRKYGDVLIGKTTYEYPSGSRESINVWVSEGTSTDDWVSVGETIQSFSLMAVQQRDTNETTATTAYLPRYFGDMLVGRTAADTGAVWVAIGLTTNDWKQIGE